MPIIAAPATEYVLPATSAQERLWLMDRLNPGSPFYNITNAVRLSGRLDVGVLTGAVAALAKRHESLRTRLDFDLDEGRVVQIVSAEAVPPLAIVDLTCASSPEPCLRRAIESCARVPFDLARGPLTRLVLLCIGPSEHALVVTMHHVVADGWSTAVFVHDLVTLYEAAADGREPDLRPLPIQLGDYATWQREWAGTAQFAAHLRRLKASLGSSQPPLRLPFDRSRPPVQTFNGSVHSTIVDAEATAAVRTLARRHGVTTFMVLLGAFAVVLARYSGQRLITVGSPVANRRRVELEGIIGPLINMLVLRVDLSGRPGFGDVIERVRQAATEAYAHSEVPFERLVEELQPERDLSAHPLFEVIFALQNTPASTRRPRELTIERIDVGTTTARVALALDVTEDETQFNCAFEFNTDLFDAVTIERMAAHFVAVIEQATRNPDRYAMSVPLSPIERPAVFTSRSSRTGAEGDACAHELVARSAAARPDDVAAVCDGASLTYRELDARASLVAGRLASCGVGPDAIVALCAERSLDMLAGLLGILKAGAAYLPLDPAHPRERLRAVVEDARPQAAVVQRGTAALLQPCDAPLVVLDDLAAADATPACAVPANLAYAIYTSGSTGSPKGVAVSHRSLANVLEGFRRDIGIGASDVLLAVTTLAFDIASLELLLPLVSGARVVIAPAEVAQDGRRLIDLLDASAATVMQATPATWRLMIEAGWAGRPDLTVLCGGEALTRELANDLVSRSKVVWNVYGPTETTIWSTTWRVGSDKGEVSLGDPIAETTLHVLDASFEPVPAGAAGELFIGGAGVARGYLRRPRLTAERFVPDAWSGATGARLYATGDLVRYASNGHLLYRGRRDRQVKVRGYRVEPLEIESALVAFAEVRDAAVTVEEIAPGDVRLVAFVAAATSDASVEDRLREHLRDRLPAYMVPWEIVFLPALPRTPSGKTDVNALRRPGRARASQARGEPKTEVEQMVAAVWREVLGAPRVGLDDNFFDLGGHSLLLARVQRRLMQAIERELPLVVLFQHPTVRTLAAYLTGATDVAPTGRERGAARSAAMRSRGRKAATRAGR